MLFKRRKKKVKRTTKQRRFNSIRFTRNISIGRKYLLAFALSIILFVSATFVVYSQLNTAQDRVNHIIDESQVKSDLVQMALLIEQQGSLVSDYILMNNNKFKNKFIELNEEIDTVSERLSHSLSKEHESHFNKVLESVEFVQTNFEEKITDDSLTETDKVYAQIQIDSHKTTSVSYMNLLIDEMEELETSAIHQVKNTMNHSNIILIIANIISITLGLIIMYFISRVISRHLKNVVHTATNIANGHLSLEKINYEGKDEIGQLANAINSLQFNMREMIHKVANAANAVSKRSDLLKQSAFEVKEGSEQMVITMDELAVGAESQATVSSNLSEKMGEFVSSISQSQQQGQAVADSTKDILHITDTGAALMDQSITQIQQIDIIVQEAVNQVRGLDERSDAITSLIEVVKSIADQTNLLALNAAIEAARAGEQGKGFAVVADEVRKLAEEVTTSVTEITAIVHDIQQETHSVASALDNGYKEVRAGMDQVKQTGESFTVISSSINEMAKNIDSISIRLQQITKNSEQVNASIENIAAVSEEAASGVEQSSASTQEASSAMDEVSASADELAHLSEQLKEHIHVFKL